MSWFDDEIKEAGEYNCEFCLKDITIHKKSGFFSPHKCICHKCPHEVTRTRDNDVLDEHECIDGTKCHLCDRYYPSPDEHLEVCRFSCPLCEETITAKGYMEHLKSSCGFETCEICDKKLVGVTKKEHEPNCRKTCDLCKKDFHHKKMEGHRIECEFSRWRCLTCGEIFGSGTTAKEHEKECRRACFICRERVLATNYEEHSRECEAQYPTAKFRTCNLCKSRILPDYYEGHQKQCFNFRWQCDSCGEFSGCAISKERHAKDCKKMKKKNSRKKEPEYEEPETKTATTVCNHCAREYPVNLMAKHLIKCREKSPSCPYCHDKVPPRLFPEHTQTCPKKPKKWTCGICNESVEGDVTKKNHRLECISEKCGMCNALFTIVDINGHRSNCALTRWKCDRCGEFCSQNLTKEKHREKGCMAPCAKCAKSVSFFDVKKHQAECEEKEEHVMCPLCCKPIVKEEMKNHTEECEKKRWKCNKCSKLVGVGINKKTHKKTDCFSPCRVCSEEILAAKFSEHIVVCKEKVCRSCNKWHADPVHHIKFDCLKVEVKCDDCDAKMLRPRLANHRCPVECPLCHLMCKAENIETHTSSKCPKRPVECKECGEGLIFEVLKMHKCHPDCPQCGKTVPKARLETHMVAECSKRPVMCDKCQKAFPAHQLPHHSCRVPCPHCNVVVNALNLDKHIKKCPHAKVKCPSCRLVYARKEEKDHVCPEVQCDQCAEYMSLASLEEHLRSVCKRIPDVEKEASPAGSEHGSQPARDVDDSHLCVVCVDARRSTVLLPCKHMMFCLPCAEALLANGDFCPICRAEIFSTMFVFS